MGILRRLLKVLNFLRYFEAFIKIKGVTMRLISASHKTPKERYLQKIFEHKSPINPDLTWIKNIKDDIEAVDHAEVSETVNDDGIEEEDEKSLKGEKNYNKEAKKKLSEEEVTELEKKIHLLNQKYDLLKNAYDITREEKKGVTEELVETKARNAEVVKENVELKEAVKINDRKFRAVYLIGLLGLASFQQTFRNMFSRRG